MGFLVFLLHLCWVVSYYAVHPHGEGVGNLCSERISSLQPKTFKIAKKTEYNAQMPSVSIN